jgi:ATP-dependent DNA helicase RecG
MYVVVTMTESQIIEYKESWRDEYIKWISGFANAQGGLLIIGKNDDGITVGVEDAKRLLEDIPNKVRDVLGIMVEVNLRNENDLEYIEIAVEKYPYPISYKGQYFFRSGSTKQELKGAALDTFLLRKQGRHWDGVPVPRISVKDLKKDTLNYFRREAEKSNRLSKEIVEENDLHLLEKLQLIEGQYLKRAAVLLFSPEPEMFVPGAYVKIGRFKTNSELLYQNEIHGSLFEQVEKTMDLLFTKYLVAEISYEGIHRRETFPYPEEGL